MFREMRRKDRMLMDEETMRILAGNAYGVLSLNGGGMYPYGVPMHYVLSDGALYFHGTREGGLKTECMERMPNVCFTVVEPLGGAKCRSAIVFGKLEEVPELAAGILNLLIEKFVPGQDWEQAKAGIPTASGRICAYRLVIRHHSGKLIDRPEGR